LKIRVLRWTVGRTMAVEINSEKAMHVFMNHLRQILSEYVTCISAETQVRDHWRHDNEQVTPNPSKCLTASASTSAHINIRFLNVSVHDKSIQQPQSERHRLQGSYFWSIPAMKSYTLIIDAASFHILVLS
jgi:hypothetical protein